MKTRKIKPKLKIPKVLAKTLQDHRSLENFPLEYYSYSALALFSSNPVLFKIKYINKDRVDMRLGVSSMVGRAFHSALYTRYSEVTVQNGLDPIKTGLENGLLFLEEFLDSSVEYSKAMPTAEKAKERFAFAYTTYVNEKNDEKEEVISVEEMIETPINVEWQGKELDLPIPLRGYLDKVIRENGKLKVVDYKTCSRFSDPDKIDGAKILQSIEYYLLAYARYGEAPYSMIFEEVKMTKSRDGKQIKRYEIVYEENELFFEFYFRLYDDVTRAINGEAVFVPNIHAMFDNEVAIISYIHRLDEEEEKASLMREMQVHSITELLKKKIENAGSMRKLLETVEKKFVSGKSLNYENMTIQDRITTKLAEYGMLLRYENHIIGHSVDLYRFNPSVGLKMNRLLSYSADIEQAVGKSNIRILAPIPDSTMVGVEIPRGVDRTFPTELPTHDPKNIFNLAMGVDVYGNAKRFDIREAPHMLVAGSSGSGKSVFLNSLIQQIINKNGVEVVLFDPKRVELSMYEKYAAMYADDHVIIAKYLSGLVDLMEYRYQEMKRVGARSIDEIQGNRMIVVIDEFGDLVLSEDRFLCEDKSDGFSYIESVEDAIETTTKNYISVGKSVKNNILKLSQKARAAGIHLILSTQRPSTDIISGSIKANFPTKAVFRVAKAVDSQVVLDQMGAEKLLGKGDFLFSSDEGIIRLQGYLC